MRIAFVRHGEPRKGEADPELTSWGRRMAGEAGDWLASRGLHPALVAHTPTARTRQTAEEVALRLGEAPVEVLPELPEQAEAWAALTASLRARLGEQAETVLVGHHPTQDMLVAAFGPAPLPIPRSHRAATLELHESGGGWRIVAAWPGRP